MIDLGDFNINNLPSSKALQKSMLSLIPPMTATLAQSTFVLDSCFEASTFIIALKTAVM